MTFMHKSTLDIWMSPNAMLCMFGAVEDAPPERGDPLSRADSGGTHCG